ncbi:serine hydrolase [Burkholderia thailandensis]|uniref:serine hydrolase n=1 Tax=Burkholderia thailandensis TaxID=57975 RepID=UPI000B2C9949|nr:peptidase [Burkholderia thailandensis]
MKATPFSSLKAMCGFVLRTSKRTVLPVVLASALAVPTFDAQAKSPVAKRHPTAYASIRTVSFHPRPGHASLVRHALATRHMRAGRYRLAGGMRRVTFSPRAPFSGRAFEPRDTSQPFGLRSNIVYMVDQHTGETLFDRNSQEVVPIASVTKLMTAMVVLDSKAPLDEPIEVTDDDRDLDKFTGSRLAIGSTLSRDDMLHIALMASENRAAAALSRYYPGGREAFVAAMNRKARSLGMVDTYFENPTGLSKHNVSTARDLVKMVEAAYQYPLIREYSTDLKYDVDTGLRTLYYHSTNILLHDDAWDIGIQKTGYIKESGICLVMQTTIGGRDVVMVLLDSAGRHSDFFDAARLRTMLTSSGARMTEANSAASAN